MIAGLFVAPSDLSVLACQGGRHLPDSAQEPGIPNDCLRGNLGVTHLYASKSIVRK